MKESTQSTRNRTQETRKEGDVYNNNTYTHSQDTNRRKGNEVIDELDGKKAALLKAKEKD